MPDWYIYLVRCCDGSLYTGITTGVEHRFAEHASGAGAKYHRGRGPLELVFQKKLGSRSLALGVETRIKKLPKIRKEELVRDNTRIDEMIRKAGT